MLWRQCANDGLRRFAAQAFQKGHRSRPAYRGGRASITVFAAALAPRLLALLLLGLRKKRGLSSFISSVRYHLEVLNKLTKLGKLEPGLEPAIVAQLILFSRRDACDQDQAVPHLWLAIGVGAVVHAHGKRAWRSLALPDDEGAEWAAAHMRACVFPVHVRDQPRWILATLTLAPRKR